MGGHCNDHMRGPEPDDEASARGPGRRARGLGRAARLTLPIVGVALIGLLGVGCTSERDDVGSGPTSAKAATRSSVPLMPPPSAAVLPGETVAELQSLLDAWVAADNGVGVTAAVVSADGSWAGAAGVDGAGDSLVPESAMAIGSMTKTFVAAEVVQLAGQGRVDLDAPISDYVTVPWDTKGATVAQVLGMRSGFPPYPDSAVSEAATADLSRSWTADEVLAMVDAEGPRQGQLGGSAEYNNLNYTVLSVLIEEVAGQPWAPALRRDLIDPAGLDRVWVQDAEQPQPPLTVGLGDPDLPVVDPNGPWLPSRSIATLVGAAGGMAADALNVARWGYLLYGGHVIDSSLIEEMTESCSEEEPYGLGTVCSYPEDALVVGHTGDMAGSYHGGFVVSRDQTTSISVLVPAGPRTLVIDIDMDAIQLLDQLAQAVVDA